VIRRTACWATACLALVPGLFFAYGWAWAQQPARVPTHATIQCGGQPYVPVTADEEQGIPLQLVERAGCGEGVTILSDPLGYTVKVRTKTGKIGYVARYQLAIGSPAATSAAGTPAASGSTRHAAQSQNAPGSTAEAAEPSKPRVYISDTASWDASGGFGNPSSVPKGALYGGYNPDLVDIYQDFTSDCSAVAVTQKKSNASFAILFDKGTSKKGIKGLGGLVKVNKITVLSRNGETVLSDEAHSADLAVQKACAAVGQTRATAASVNPSTKTPH
jgi:hypothetical protein